PAHGLGIVSRIEAMEIEGNSVEMITVSFDGERMQVSLPLCTAGDKGLRSVANKQDLVAVYKRLSTKIRPRRTMWSRRAVEYDMKINSGDLVSVAEVVRELHRTPEQEEASYSERVLYSSAINRLAREMSVIEQCTEDEARERICTHMEKIGTPPNPALPAAVAA
nr:CarD family transcriptional regulator [Alphaproteobacteria bacterium]